MLVKIITMYNEEESIDHIFLHYLKARVPIWLMFSLFDAPWVLFMVICETMLEWHGSIRKNVQEGLEFCSFMHVSYYSENEKSRII